MGERMRPDNWKQPYTVPMPALKELALAERLDTTRFLINDAYEAGADAYEKALIAERRSLLKSDVSFIVSELFKRPLRKGYWVFIEEA